MQFEFSAGGIVYKKEQDSVFILVGQHGKYLYWGFPKGHIGDEIKGESKEEAALREVQEETGIEAEIIKPLSSIEYWYVLDGEKRKKKVYYFLMRYVGGDTSKHDHDLSEVVWLPIEDVAQRLSKKGDKTVWDEAKVLIEQQNR